MIRNFLVVGLGGALGAMLRYGMTQLGNLLAWSSNLSTFAVNVLGSFIMGLLVSSCEQGTWLLLATVGLCGGFTTFSTFSNQTVTLLQQGKFGPALLYALGTVVVCVLAAWLGCLLGQKLS
ncbi:MAG: fluoride efflux transporter CrcB [Bacteroidales bacterium]|nr:fluoride efflux transporter CrcB [Bacteroidales bacterium]